MVKTKLTKRAGARKCPKCAEVFHGDVEFSNHVVQCAMQEYTCDFCDFTSQKECNVKRHMKRAHKGFIPIVKLKEERSGNKIKGLIKERFSGPNKAEAISLYLDTKAIQ